MQEVAKFFQHVIETLGYPGIFLLVVLESTLVPVPRPSCSRSPASSPRRDLFSLPVVLVLNSVGALVGSGLCYWLGAAGGKPLLLKYGKYFLIRQKDIEKTERWFASHGKATVLVARFVPVVRHIISLPAGIARMRLLPFLVQTFIGATLWGGFLILLGYYMGEHWDTVANKLKRFDLVIGGAIVVAVVVFGVRFFVKRRRERALAENKAD